jgi:geranylgeranyl diphosphate synthase type I
MREMLLHTASAGGKRIRPALVLTACEAVGGDPGKILSAAASVEMLHTFTLVHDDIMDDDKLRRGKPTVHALWGVNMGIIVGDTLYAKAFESIVDARKNGIPEGKVLDALEAFNHANAEIHEGQMMDMFFEDRDEVSEREYFTMIEKKTGALIEASLKIGAILGGGEPREVQALASYGRDVGVAFQIKDDLLDLTGDEKKLGKPVGSDIRQGKKSVIIVHAIASAAPEKKKRILATLKAGECSQATVREVIGILKETGSIAYAQETLSKLIAASKKSLKPIAKGSSKDVLIGLADYIIERTY